MPNSNNLALTHDLMRSPAMNRFGFIAGMFTAFAVFLLPGETFAAPASPAAGTYAPEGGGGFLKIEPGTKGTMTFSLQVSGPNGSECGIEKGTIQGNKAVLKTEEDNICTLTFKQKNGTITLAAIPECLDFCGMRAGLDGTTFLTSAQGCAPDQLKKMRTTFKALYDKKKYAQARATLEPVLKKCKATLDELTEEGAIRNDLAVTYHKLGDYAACRDILEPYAYDAAQNDDDIDDYKEAPITREVYLETVAAARTNLALCDKDKHP